MPAEVNPAEACSDCCKTSASNCMNDQMAAHCSLIRAVASHCLSGTGGAFPPVAHPPMLSCFKVNVLTVTVFFFGH